MSQIILLAGGGGHTAYAYALAQHLSGKCEMEMIVPQGDQLSVDRLKKFGNVRTLLKPRTTKTALPQFLGGLVKSFLKSSSMIRGRSVVVSTGSNFCLTPSFHAWLDGIPLINLESSIRFTRASKTVKILDRFATITALQWEEQKKLLPHGVVFGPLLAKPEVKPYNGGYILVTGGTFGHKLLFETLDSSNIEKVVLQAGALYTTAYSKNHPSWKVIDYTDHFHDLIAGADVVVTHFGETIIDSALVYGKPTVISVNPEWTRTVGLDDATILASKVNGVMLKEFSSQSLTDAIEQAKLQKTPQVVNGAQLLSKSILELVEKQ